MVNFPNHILTATLNSPTLLDLSLSSDTSICSALAFHCLGNFNHVVVSVSIDFPSHSKGGDSFHHAAYVYFYAD